MDEVLEGRARLTEQVKNHAADLRRLAREANELAAKSRKQGGYYGAEELDRRAEALNCAAALAETRGLA